MDQIVFVLRANSDGRFVAQPGSAQSYTRRLDQARLFATREAAERERCVGSETIQRFTLEVNP